MLRVERHIQVKDDQLDYLCFLSKNLYNYVNYLIRQEFIATHKLLDKYNLVHKLAKQDQADFRALPSNVAQQIVYQLFKNWKSFFKANKDYKKHPEKYKSRPKPPQYKHKENGRNLLVFTKASFTIKEGFIHFAKDAIQPLETKISDIREIRVIPQSSCYAIEVIYNKEAHSNENLDKNLYVSIDLGINNLATLTTNSETHPVLVNGRILKSMNRFYNKEKARLQSYIGDKGTSKRIEHLTLRRNNKVHDYMHKASRFIINYCLKHQIGNIVIGYNPQWKNEVNLGKRTNQKFVSIPYLKLVKQIQYKAEEVGINVVLKEESYTSKCDALALEEIKKHDVYLGKRVKRGLFRSSMNKLINADVNGSLNILRKVIGNGFINPLNIGLADNPVRINPYKYAL